MATAIKEPAVSTDSEWAERLDGFVERATRGLDGAARARSGGGRPDRLGDDRRRARERVELAELAMEETQFGVLEDKVLKNYIATEFLYDYLRDKKSVGVIDEDRERALQYVAEPIGVVLALLPITNPTSTTLFKSIVCAKTRNALDHASVATRGQVLRPRRRAPPGGGRGGRPAAQLAPGDPRPVARGLAVPVPPPGRRLHLDDWRAEGGGGRQRRRQAVPQRRRRQRAGLRAPQRRHPDGGHRTS